MTTSLQTHFSFPTNLASLNTIPQKLCLSLCITNWSLPSAIRKFPAYVSSTSLLHLTLWIIPSSSSDFPLGSASLALSAILVLLLILISLFPTTSPTSPAPASCTSVTSAASDPCLTLKLPPPSPPPSSILNYIAATPSFTISTPPKYSVCSSS